MSDSNTQKDAGRSASTEVREARRRAEARVADLRRALDDELGLASPRRRSLWWLLGAGAVGLALAGGVAVRRRQKRLG